jgi:hypothetical protein
MKRDISKIIEKINYKGEEFVPIVELLQMAMDDIYGNCEEGMASFLSVHKEDHGSAFGIVTHFYDDRVSFTLAYEKGWKDFKLCIGEGTDMKLDQLQLFDKLREWNFKL